MLRVAFQGLGRCSTVHLRRNLGLSAVVTQKAAAKANLDPIQQLFVDKIQDFKKQSSGGKAPGMTAAVQKELDDQLERVAIQYNPNKEDFSKAPVFTFTDPILQPVGTDVKPGLAATEEVLEVEPEDEDDVYFM